MALLYIENLTKFCYLIIMNLKEIRTSKGLTQKEVSTILGIPLRTIKRYETNPGLESSFKYKQIYDRISKISAKRGKKSQKSLNIAVIGAGYVGLPMATLLAQKNKVAILEIDQNKIDKINRRECYLKDSMIDQYFADEKFSLVAQNINGFDFAKQRIVIIATNTDFSDVTGQFDMSSVLSSISSVRKSNPNCLIVIKSTVPMGFTCSLNDSNIIFCPEFLREGTAVYDLLFPSRIIIGCDHMNKDVKDFANCMLDISLGNKSIVYMSSHEAEAAKLFANAYLAMRVAFMNELDTYAEESGLVSEKIIKGISLDPRIGDYYNNPSFGYGGYCLPKDTAQLENSFLHIPNNNIIRAIVESNATRKEYIISRIIKLVGNKKKTIGFYKVSMKKDSDNYRNSSSLEIANRLISMGYKVLIYDENYKSDNTTTDFGEFVQQSDIIVANRIDKSLDPFASKVYTRDKMVQKTN